MDRFEIRDEEIDVEDITRKIRENIKRRKGAYPEDKEQLLGQPGEQVSLCHQMGQVADGRENNLVIWADEIEKDLRYINSNWDIQNNSYFIDSHRPHTGKFLIKGRELVHGEVKRYVDPMIWKQKEFNVSVARTLNETAKKISEISQRTIEINDEISAQVKAVVSAMNQEIENRAWLANTLDRKIDNYQNIDVPVPTKELELNYFHFEEQFRGSTADIKRQQMAFVHYFEGCKNVLDIGCGRGEFLELLQESGIGGQGVDLDSNMVDYCLSKGLNAEKVDAISYLERIEDDSLDGVFLDQVVEHLDPNYLIKMLRLCHKKLNSGHRILIETMNPLTLVSFVNFYLDMSHKKPVHPETLKFLLISENFRDIETKFFTPVPDGARLKKLNTDVVDERNGKLIEVYNYNIDMLNNILYGPQDYVVIGTK